MTGGKSHNNLPASLLLSVILLVLTSCHSKNHFSDVYGLSNGSWNINDRPVFRAPVTDTLTAFDILLTIRTGSEYPYRNIFLFVNTVSPEGYGIRDTVEYMLADERGRWYGKGLGDIHDLSVPFKENVIFPMSGTYRFEIQQGMRTENLPGVEDIGIRIRSHRK